MHSRRDPRARIETLAGADGVEKGAVRNRVLGSCDSLAEGTAAPSAGAVVVELRGDDFMSAAMETGALKAPAFYRRPRRVSSAHSRTACENSPSAVGGCLFLA
jgi:hypothetical protein